MRLYFLSILNFIFINFLIAQHGTIDESFTGFPAFGVFYGPIKKIQLQPDGKIIGIGDRHTGFESPDYNTILRINQDGGVDYSFNSGTGFMGGDPVDLDIQNDGKIIITGHFSSFDGTDVKNIARLNADGSLDTTFNVDSIIAVSPSMVELQSDGKIIVVGYHFDIDSSTISSIPFVKRLNIDGSTDPSFNLEVDSLYEISNLVVQPDDKIILHGRFMDINGNLTGPTILRFHSDGSLDSSFSIGTGPDIFQGPSPFINNIAVQNDGKIIVTGRFSSFNGVERNGIVRLNSDGSPDMSFVPGEGFPVILNTCCLINTISFKKNGKIFLGGDHIINYDNHPTDGNFVLNPDGSFDTTYQGIANYPGIITITVTSSIILENGKYLVAGNVSTDFYSPYKHIVRLNSELNITPVNSIMLGDNISIYPNPFDNYFFIASQNTQFESACYIYNYLGELVYSNQLSNQTSQIDFTSYPSGLYLVLIKNGESESSYKIIKR